MRDPLQVGTSSQEGASKVVRKKKKKKNLTKKVELDEKSDGPVPDAEEDPLAGIMEVVEEHPPPQD